jgi:ketosteroid isomerase-like protein
MDTPTASALRAADAKAQALVADRNAQGLLVFLEEGATNYPPNAPSASGKAAFRASFEEAFKLPGFAAAYPRPSKVVVAESGELGYTVADEEFSMSGPDGRAIKVRSRYLAVWRRQPDGSWKIIENIWNFAEPFPPNPA